MDNFYFTLSAVGDEDWSQKYDRYWRFSRKRKNLVANATVSVAVSNPGLSVSKRLQKSMFCRKACFEFVLLSFSKQNCVADPRAKGLMLSSYLLKPLQRICKYPLLIREVCCSHPKVKCWERYVVHSRVKWFGDAHLYPGLQVVVFRCTLIFYKRYEVSGEVLF